MVRRPSPASTSFVTHERRVLYVGKARDLRARLRSYFQTGRQRPTVEAALDQLDHVEWRLTGSELAAALEEVRLIRELRPAANTRTPEPERYVYLHRRGERVVVSPLPSSYGPFRRRAQAQRAAGALKGCTAEEFDELLDGAVLDRLRSRLASLTEADEELEARYLRRRIGSLERAIAHLRRLERIRELDVCVLAPSLEPGRMDAYIVSGGRLVGPGADSRTRAIQQPAGYEQRNWMRCSSWSPSCSGRRPSSRSFRSGAGIAGGPPDVVTHAHDHEGD